MNAKLQELEGIKKKNNYSNEDKKVELLNGFLVIIEARQSGLPTEIKGELEKTLERELNALKSTNHYLDIRTTQFNQFVGANLSGIKNTADSV